MRREGFNDSERSSELCLKLDAKASQTELNDWMPRYFELYPGVTLLEYLSNWEITTVVRSIILDRADGRYLIRSAKS